MSSAYYYKNEHIVLFCLYFLVNFLFSFRPAFVVSFYGFMNCYTIYRLKTFQTSKETPVQNFFNYLFLQNENVQCQNAFLEQQKIKIKITIMYINIQ